LFSALKVCFSFQTFCHLFSISLKLYSLIIIKIMDGKSSQKMG
jgi:hypothetical protein